MFACFPGTFAIVWNGRESSILSFRGGSTLMFSRLPYRHCESLVCVLAVLAISPLTAQPIQVVADTSLPTQQSSTSIVHNLPATTNGGSALIAVQGINSPDRDNSPIISADGTIMTIQELLLTIPKSCKNQRELPRHITPPRTKRIS